MANEPKGFTDKARAADREALAIRTAFPRMAEIATQDVDYSEPSTVYVGGAGNVSVVPWSGSASVTFVGVPAGMVVPVLVKRVNSSGTTASSLVRVYEVI